MSQSPPEPECGPSTTDANWTGPSLEPYVTRLERFELFSTNQCFYIVGSNKLNTAYRIIKIDRTLIERPSVVGATPTNQHQTIQPSSSQQMHATTPSISASRSFGAASSFSPRRAFNTANVTIGDFAPTPSVVGVSSSGSELPTVQQSNSTVSNSNTPSTPAPPSGQNNNVAADGQHTANPKSRPLSDFVSEDPNVYTQEEIKDVLDMIHDGTYISSLVFFGSLSCPDDSDFSPFSLSFKGIA